MDIAALCELADQNAVDAARLFAAHEPGAVTREQDGMLLVASALPMISLFHSAARQLDPATDPLKALRIVAEFGREHDRDMAFWVSAAAGLDVVEAARAAGHEHRFSLAGMALQEAPEAPVPADPAVELRRVEDEAGVGDFAQVHGELFAAAGKPFEGAHHFATAGVLLAPEVAGYVAYLDGRPASCAMTVSSGRVAGLFEVATGVAARRRGLGELVSRAATRAGFELGAEAVVLQATPMGEPVYRRLGFEKITEYGAVRIDR